jgi:hypothetical protein
MQTRISAIAVAALALVAGAANYHLGAQLSVEWKGKKQWS